MYSINSVSRFVFGILAICISTSSLAQICMNYTDSSNDEDKTFCVDFASFLSQFQHIKKEGDIRISQEMISDMRLSSTELITSFKWDTKDIPFFRKYPLFRLDCFCGYLVVIYYCYNNENTDIEYINFLFFNKIGQLVSQIFIPYFSLGLFSTDEGYHQIVQVSNIHINKGIVSVEQITYEDDLSDFSSNPKYHKIIDRSTITYKLQENGRFKQVIRGD